MHLSSTIYFHGATGDKILDIVATGAVKPDSDQRIFFSRFTPEHCFMHGPDRKRKASFVIKLRVPECAETRRLLTESPGVRDTAVVLTDKPLAVEVLEMYVRRLNQDEPAVTVCISGTGAIQHYLAF